MRGDLGNVDTGDSEVDAVSGSLFWTEVAAEGSGASKKNTKRICPPVQVRCAAMTRRLVERRGKAVVGTEGELKEEPAMEIRGSGRCRDFVSKQPASQLVLGAAKLGTRSQPRVRWNFGRRS